MNRKKPRKRHFWIFDLDGTLTVPAHDFEGIRMELGLPSGKPILEEIAKLPNVEAAAVLEKLDKIELEVARKAVRQTGAVEMIEDLRSRSCQAGIFSRNSERNIRETLRQCGLKELFPERNIVGRELCEPKPDPQGIHLLLSRWKGSPDEAVIVGDYLYDMVAGLNAGIVTVGFDETGNFPWKDYADYCVADLPSILSLPIVPD